MQSCRPAPAHHRVPCPHQARHLVVSASTIPWTFGPKFIEKFRDSYKPGHLSQKRIFALVRTGYEALFQLSGPDSGYLSTRTSELRHEIHLRGGLSVGVHIRHGDRHPWEFQYQDSYIPLSSYIQAAHVMLASTLSPTNTENSTFIANSRILLASDDPEVYDSPELQSTARAQSHIQLASKSTLDAVQGSPTSSGSGPHKKFVEGNVGWEGGFFSDVFWGLGRTASGIGVGRRARPEREIPSEGTLRLRELVARAYLLDLNIIGSADGVVCGVSSVTCRLLAVMLGWESVMKGRWKNVDGGYGWVGFV